MKAQLHCGEGWSLPSELGEIATVPSICSTGFQQQGDHSEH